MCACVIRRKEKQMIRHISWAAVLGASIGLALPVAASGQGQWQGQGSVEQGRDWSARGQGRASESQARRVVEGWPDASRRSAGHMLDSYGAPDSIADDRLVWRNNGQWHETVLLREPVQHNFPFPHEDVLAQTIFYDVPLERYEDLVRFDGSLLLDRTRGTITARCDMEAANFLALNLAHETINGQRSVSEARRIHAEAMSEFMDTGNKIAAQRRLQFQPMTAATAGDPDQRSRWLAMDDD
jgi:hypothetical protein